MPKGWSCSALSENYLRISKSHIREVGYRFRIRKFADLHIESIHCYLSLFHRLAQECVDLDIPFFFPGDILDLMMGRTDDRSIKNQIHPDIFKDMYDNGKEYFDAARDFAYKQIRPYATHLFGFSLGNHEQKVRKYQEICLLNQLIGMLNADKGVNVFYGQESGWIDVRFEAGKASESVLIDYHHGVGRKTLASAHRWAATNEPARFYVVGHHHDPMIKPFKRTRVSRRGKTYGETYYHVWCPSFQDTINNRSKGWAVRSGHIPKVLAAADLWMEYRPNSGPGSNFIVNANIVE